MRSFLHIIVLGFVLCSAASAQWKNDEMWISVGAGVTVRELLPGFTQALTVAYNSNNFFVSARVLNGDLGRGGIGLGTPPAHWDNVQEYSMNVGYAKHGESALYLFSLGIGQLNGKYDNDRQNASFKTLCIPITGQVLLKLSPRIGIGPTFAFNLNARHSFVVISFNIQMGFQV